MPTILASYFTRFLPWILAGLLATGGAIYVVHLRDQLTVAHQDVAAAQATIDQLKVINEQNLETLRRLQAEDAVWQTTLTTTIASDDDITRFTESLLASVAAVPAKDDAPVASVLAGTLASIAKEQGATR